MSNATTNHAGNLLQAIASKKAANARVNDIQRRLAHVRAELASRRADIQFYESDEVKLVHALSRELGAVAASTLQAEAACAGLERGEVV